MIEIVQAGQAGKTGLLFDMHRLRARVFKDMLKWDVHVTSDGLEVDSFDLPDTVYLLALDAAGRVIGNWRLLPTDGPTMIREVWPAFLDTLPMPSSDDAWEVSRFAVSPLSAEAREAIRQSQQAVGEMFCALTELCIATGIREVYTLYDARIAKVIRRIDCEPAKTSSPMPIDGIPCQTGVFKTDAAMLQRLRAATGIAQEFIGNIDLPPVFADRLGKTHKEMSHV